MKNFSNYQHVDGQEMTERDKQEVGSKFWNKGKWDNFVLPFLPDDCSEMTLIDMGCNAGLFLKLAEDKGFNKVIGVDKAGEAFRRAVAYRERNGGKYELRFEYLQKCLADLPMSDYTVLAHSHYYFPMNDWSDYLAKISLKTEHCIIVTSPKVSKPKYASSRRVDVRNYFKHWDEVGYVPRLSREGDPLPRRTSSLCFKSPSIERVPLDSINCNSRFGGKSYWKQLDDGINPKDTHYHKYVTRRQKRWSEKEVEKYIVDKEQLYESVKAKGILYPSSVDSKNNIIDGGHRYCIAEHLGHKSIFIRRT